MRWLGLYFPALPLELHLRGELQPGPLAVSRVDGGRELLSRCNAEALALGIRPGMTASAARALHGGLRVLQRDDASERRAIEEIAGIAYGFSSRIVLEPLGLLLEIDASLRLFGSLDALLGQVREAMAQLGYRLQWAVAPTPLAAGVLARHRPESRANGTDELLALAAALPLRCLTREPVALELMQDIGLERIGDCLNLPRPELARRVGPGLALLFDRLLGRAPDPRPVWQPPQRFRMQLPLLVEITAAPALLFPARRLIQSLCAFLRSRGGGAQHLQWELRHRDAAPSRFELGLLRPGRDPERMLELLRGRIERLQLRQPVIELMLRVDDWRPFVEQNSDLFGSETPDHGLIERLRARLGEEAVHGLSQMPDHRPELAWRRCDPGEGEAAAAAPVLARRPLWLLGEPQSLPEQAGHPSYGGPLQLASIPERIETGWWDGRMIARDYYLARNPDGERLWIYRDRHSGHWYLHGLFA